ncbi:hypothetical protein [Aliivibrio fischeri]|uniref:hypothetical protein n=1 Tax=Aliivibrio fischeri TaxID=668 RepID=UPI0016647AD4|nr:hypothetical protein [Aliivibrio fischeri]USR97045.1 hypothetical protein AVFI_17820 [Aliivibrio fischeri ATCC 7744 = JCM 18803 = DSM 507]GGK49602.1 hypothetical protein GCM10007987_35870 [Aliivibrio fischeri]
MKLPVSIFLLFFATSAYASVGDAQHVFEKKMQQCISLPEATVTKINDSWLRSLDDNSRKVALLLIKDHLMHKCVNAEEKEYVYQLYLKYKLEGDIVPLSNWLAFKENTLIENHKLIVDESFLNNVVRLSNSGIFGDTFDVKKALDAIQY